MLPSTKEVQTASRVDILARADELGVDSVSFLQKVTPFRWKLEHTGERWLARLINEKGEDSPTAVRSYRISEPDRVQLLNYDDVIPGIEVEPPGVLLSAINDKKVYAALVSVAPAARLTALTSLGVSIAVSSAISEPEHLPKLVAHLRLWMLSQQTLGPLSLLRRAEVCNALEDRLIAILCGTQWSHQFRQWPLVGLGKLPIAYSEALVLRAGFGARLRQWNWHIHPIPEDESEFVRLATTYNVCDEASKSSMALRAAFSPISGEFARAEEKLRLWADLAANPILARGAFFARKINELSRRSELETRYAESES